jgi:hypothetical protein
MSDVKRLWLGAPMPLTAAATIGFGNFTINSAGGSIDRIAWALQLPADTWTDIGFRYGARAGTPVAHQAGAQSLGTTGLPDGTYLGGGSAKKAFTPPADATWDATWRKLALDASFTTTEGQWVAPVIEPTGTPDGSNNSSFTQGLTNAWASRHGAPYNLTQTDAAAFSKVSARAPIICFYSASQCYGFPVESIFTTTTNTNGNRQAMKFTLPAGSGATKKIDAFRWLGQIAGTGNTYKVGIWNAAGTALMEITIDSDFAASINVNTTYEHLFDDAAVSLDFGTTYYIGVESTGSLVGLNGLTADTATEAAAFSGGSDFCLSTWNGSAWTDDATTRPLCEFRLVDVTEPAGGGGGPSFGKAGILPAFKGAPS